MLATCQRAVILGPGVKRFCSILFPSTYRSLTHLTRGCSPVGNSCTGIGERKCHSWAGSPPPCLAQGCVWGAPSAPTLGLGRWSLSQAHLPVCQQGALNIRELLGRMYRSESPSSKRSPRWCAAVLGMGNPARESPGCWQAGGSCGHLHWFFLPHETTRKFSTVGLVESTKP